MIYQFRCEMCDEYLPMLQLSKLCAKCYEIRTIVKCYDTDKVLDCLKENFKVKFDEKSKKMKPLEKSNLYVKKDGKWIKNQNGNESEYENDESSQDGLD